MSDIFLSYASEDRERVRSLAEALMQEGWSVFWDRTIPLGKMWHKMLAEELDACRCFVVVWSKHSIESEWVLEEAGLAKRKGLTFAPILLDAVELPLGYQLIQAADLSAWDGSPNSPTFQNLVRDIRMILGPPAEPEPEPAEPTPPEFEALKSEPSKPPQVEPHPKVSAGEKPEPIQSSSRKLFWIIGGIAVIGLLMLFLTVGPFVWKTRDSNDRREVKPTGSQVAKKLGQIKMVTLPPPDFKKDSVHKVSRSANIKLKQLSREPNQIIDEAAWFATYNLSLPEYKVPNPFMQVKGDVPNFVPTEFHGLMLIRAIRSGDRLLLMYGENFAGGHILLAQNTKSREIEYGLDFSNYKIKQDTTNVSFPVFSLSYAFQIDDTLYVSYGNSGYARESQGRTAYVSAIDVKGMKALWHSAPLVSNAANFEMLDDYLITGYGFTAELDFLYILRRRDGEVVEKIPLKSGPSYIILKGDQLYVRTYNTNYIFQILQ